MRPLPVTGIELAALFSSGVLLFDPIMCSSMSTAVEEATLLLVATGCEEAAGTGTSATARKGRPESEQYKQYRNYHP
jgi:hypothetical protein